MTHEEFSRPENPERSLEGTDEGAEDRTSDTSSADHTPREDETEETRRLQEEIARLREKLKELQTDTLTGAMNRAGLEGEAERFDQLGQRSEQKEHREQGPKPLNVVFVDLNGFKPVNDTYGHEVGDEILKEVVAQLQGALRSSDMVVRYGGDEFLVVFEADTSGRATVVYKVREAIGRARIEREGTEIGIGASVGVATHKPGETLNDTIARADEAMYQEKGDTGR
ncbi:MAG: GGDEF domain-containing protein [Candidatus Paceibacterota bacterium]